MSNKDIREKALQLGVKHWQIAKHLGIAEDKFSKMLREELPQEKKREVLKAIEEIKKEV